MGVVYQGRDVRLGRDVALKTAALCTSDNSRLRAEAGAMATLNHEGLATLYQLEFWRDTPVLVEEYLPGGTLAERIANGPLAVAEAVAIALRLADALAYMHGRGLVHGDVKPGNIAFTANGAPKFVDFGTSALTDSGCASRGGTRRYRPPEFGRRVISDASIDLWALAATLFESVSGRPAVAAASYVCERARPMEHGERTVGDRSRRAALRSFFEQALAHRPENRFETAAAMRDALKALAKTLKESSVHT
jgi:serine/threonine-protein kinase